MIPVILGCDPGHDDAIAILYAARHVALKAITTVFGNAAVADTTRNALQLRDLAGLDVPVAQGCGQSLLGQAAPTVFHGQHGLAGAPDLPEPRGEPVNAHAATLIIETAHAFPGEIALVATGPLTNLALALRLEPRLATWLRSISIMGGSTDVGNETAWAEANVFRDPEAADIVFRSGARIRLAGLNLTRQARIDRSVATRLRELGGPVRTVVASMLDYYISRYEDRDGTAHAPMHDPTAVLALIRPDLIAYRELEVAVQLTPGPLRGMTAFDLRDFRRSPAAVGSVARIHVGLTINGPAAVSHVFDSIQTYG